MNDYKEFRANLAADIMKIIISDHYQYDLYVKTAENLHDGVENIIASDCVSYADALIKELNK